MSHFFITIAVFTAIAALSYCLVRFIQVAIEQYEKRYISHDAQTLEEMFIFMEPKQLLKINLASSIFFLLFGLFVAQRLIYIILIAAFGFFLPRLYIRRVRHKRLERFNDQLVDALMTMSNSLRAGMSLAQAIAEVEREMPAPISQEFGIVLKEHRLGVMLPQALENMARRMPSDDLWLAVTSANIVIEMGGNLTMIFQNIAHVIRERSKLEKKTKALTAQGRLQGLVVGLMPTILGAILYLLDPPAMMRMFTTTIGNVAIAVVIVLQVIGYIMIRKVTTIEV